MGKVIDLTGQKFGRWTVIKRVQSETCQPKFLCRCECGTEQVIASQNLRSGNTLSCGCQKKEYSNLVGKKFGRLTVVKRVENSKCGAYQFLCKCDCGNESVVIGSALRRNRVKSCGCLREIISKEKNTKHGKTKHRLYHVWAGIKRRCYNPTSAEYHNYGGRGITVCQEWLYDFQNFYKWAMVNGYDENAPRGECTIDRIDVNGNYEPSNCRWADMKTQTANKRPSSEWEEKGTFIEINGKTKNLANWCKEYGISYDTVMSRVHIRKWDYIKAITTPVTNKKAAQ